MAGGGGEVEGPEKPHSSFMRRGRSQRLARRFASALGEALLRVGIVGGENLVQELLVEGAVAQDARVAGRVVQLDQQRLALASWSAFSKSSFLPGRSRDTLRMREWYAARATSAEWLL